MPKSLVAAALLALAAFLSCTGGASPARADEAPPENAALVLAADLPQDSELMARARRAYAQVFAGIGRRVELRSIPYLRSLREIEAGRVDGDFFRASRFGEGASFLVRVDEPLRTFRFGIYVRDPSLSNLRSLGDLLAWTGEPLRVGYGRGVLWIEETLERSWMGAVHRLVPLSDQFAGMHMLAAGRLDVFLTSDLMAGFALAEQDLKDAGVVRAGVLCEQKGYIYLHRRYADLVPALEAAIRRAKAEGAPFDDTFP